MDDGEKRALDRAVVPELTRDPGLRPGNVFIDPVEVEPENWSFGEGAMQDGPPISVRRNLCETGSVLDRGRGAAQLGRLITNRTAWHPPRTSP
jgi:hypothetical protein